MSYLGMGCSQLTDVSPRTKRIRPSVEICFPERRRALEAALGKPAQRDQAHQGISEITKGISEITKGDSP